MINATILSTGLITTLSKNSLFRQHFEKNRV